MMLKTLHIGNYAHIKLKIRSGGDNMMKSNELRRNFETLKLNIIYELVWNMYQSFEKCGSFALKGEPIEQVNEAIWKIKVQHYVAYIVLGACFLDLNSLE